MISKCTSRNNGHDHAWDPKAKFTSFDNNHDHPIDLKKKLALKGKTSNHTHKLLNSIWK